MILDKPKNIGQRRLGVSRKMLIAKPAPVAQGIERSPPKPPGGGAQVAAAAPIPLRRSSKKTTSIRAKRLTVAIRRGRILDSY
jgi:hypothetical protein